MSTQPASQFLRIPLDKLELCPDQVRQHKANGIEAMAKSIEVSGLLQNLVVSTDGDGTYQVHAGSRRLRALQLLRDRGAIPADYSVPCQTIHRGNAIAAGLAENTLREAMHPADEFEAFRKLVDAGEPIEDVAAAFGVTATYVQQRLRLARVSPRLLAEYRAGTMKLGQLQAFTVSEDHVRQEAVWFDDKRGHKPNEYHIRDALTDKALPASDPRVRFVGLDAYEAAGGAVARDLFASQAFALDADLVDRLANEKLQAQAEALRAEGWGFVEVVPEIDYTVREAYRPAKVERQKRVPTPEESDRLAQLRAREQELAAALDAVEDGDDYASNGEDLEEQHYDVKQDIEALEASLYEYAPEVRRNTGVVLGFNYSGVEVMRAVKPAKGAQKPVAAAAEPGAKADAQPTGAPNKPDLSAKLVLRLTAHRVAALQLLLAGNPKVALAATVHKLAAQSLVDDYAESLVHVSATPANLEKYAAEITDSRALQGLRAIASRWRDRLPARADLLWSWLLAREVGELLELQAYLVATTLDCGWQAGGTKPADQLADALGLDMADYWEATEESFFAAVSDEVGRRAVGEAGRWDHPALGQVRAGVKFTKAERAQLYATAMRGSRWLPKPLRGPKAAAPKKAPAKAAAKKAAAKAAPKKRKSKTPAPLPAPATA